MSKKLTEQEKLYNKLERLSKKANKNIRELQKAYPNKTWSEKILEAKLTGKGKNGLTSTGLIKKSKKMSEAELRRSIKATEEFLKDKRSTVKGMERTKKKLKQKFKESVKKDFGFTTQDADNVYQLFEDEAQANLFKYFTPSELYALIKEAHEKGISNEKDFVNLFRKHIDFSENKGIVKDLQAFYKNIYKGLQW